MARTPTTAPHFLYRLFRHVLPAARQEIASWTERARAIPDPQLRRQALASLAHKRFHADGGSVYAAVDLRYTLPLVRLIVALQTISDYLDNLCDRTGSYDEEDFARLHWAMQDAIRPGSRPRGYYALRDNPDDGGYLHSLVQTCQEVLATLPGYPAVRDRVAWLVDRYCELQTLKHIQPADRAQRLVAWWQPYRHDFPDIEWWEFAAATGSTLAVFALFLAATSAVDDSIAEEVFAGYFPWVCGLHILLDYLIDLEEDRHAGDFNFVSCYECAEQAHARIRWFARKGWEQAKRLQGGLRIHRDVVHGLLGMYLSDSKVRRQTEVRRARRMLLEFGPTAWVYYSACMLYRLIR